MVHQSFTSHVKNNVYVHIAALMDQSFWGTSSWCVLLTFSKPTFFFYYSFCCHRCWWTSVVQHLTYDVLSHAMFLRGRFVVVLKVQLGLIWLPRDDGFLSFIDSLSGFCENESVSFTTKYIDTFLESWQPCKHEWGSFCFSLWLWQSISQHFTVPLTGNNNTWIQL